MHAVNTNTNNCVIPIKLLRCCLTFISGVENLHIQNVQNFEMLSIVGYVSYVHVIITPNKFCHGISK